MYNRTMRTYNTLKSANDWGEKGLQMTSSILKLCDKTHEAYSGALMCQHFFAMTQFLAENTALLEKYLSKNAGDVEQILGAHIFMFEFSRMFEFVKHIKIDPILSSIYIKSLNFFKTQFEMRERMEK